MGSNPIGLTIALVRAGIASGWEDQVNDEIEALKARRAELERQIAELESLQTALYMPGITMVPPQGVADGDADQQLAHLRAAIIEIDTQIGTLAAGGRS